MSSLQLDPRKTALVVIDLQPGIVARETAPHTSSQVIERSARLAKRLREKGGTVVYVRVDMANFLQLPVDTPTRDPKAPPPPPAASELVPEAGNQPDDILITKRHWGAFAGTELEQTLKQRGMDTVVLTGISTNAGVESTVRQGTGMASLSLSWRMRAPERTPSRTSSPSRRLFPAWQESGARKKCSRLWTRNFRDEERRSGSFYQVL